MEKVSRGSCESERTIVNSVLSFSDLSPAAPRRGLLGLACLYRLTVVLEVAAEKLLEENREPSHPSVEDALDLAANQVLCTVA